MVRETGLEPVRCEPHAPQTCASASSATAASRIINLPMEGVSIDLSYRAVSSRVLSAQVSLTTVFGMGTGGPSPLMTLTIKQLFIARFFCFFSFVPHMGWCTFRDSTPGPTD